MKNKIIISLVSIFVVALVLFFANQGPVATEPLPAQNKESDQILPVSELPQSSEQTKPLSNDPKDVAWNLFQKYLSYNKSLDLDAVKSVVHKVSAICNAKIPTKECKDRMTSAYSYGVKMKKQDFINVWSDQKQIILATNFWTEEGKDTDDIGRFRSIIFFVRDEGGVLKLLSFSPSKGGVTNKGEASNEEILSRIARYTEDNDEDGKADYEEECLHRYNDSECKKTNPKLRDTDGDGFWDGVEDLF